MAGSRSSPKFVTEAPGAASGMCEVAEQMFVITGVRVSTLL